ncbi:MAG: hypothetical protein LBU89_01370, partial [Fibromonadaceae bacterium]|nr:hypothetical protein [Fibromonadaceae bacterium]
GTQSSSSEIIEIPIMSDKVVSYQKTWHGLEYMDFLGYEPGFTTDKDILKLWFPHIFNDEQAKSECNYFALYFITNTSPFSSHLIFSQDMILQRIVCTWKKGPGVMTDDWVYETMLICDDKAGTLRKSIDLDSIHFIYDPNWDCESGKGGPKEEDVYF